MNKYVWPIVFLIAAGGLQGNLPHSMEIWGAKPDLILVVLFGYSLAEEPAFGAMLGFLAGLLQGSAVGISLGSYIVTRTLIGFLAGLVNTRLFSENPIVPVLSAGWMTMVCETGFLLANPRADIGLTLKQVVGESIYNALFTLVLYMLLRHWEDRRKMRLVNARL